MIRSNQPGKLVPVYLYIRTTDVQFRIKTEFLVRPEFWSESKQEMKPMFFDLMDYTMSQRDEVAQGLKDNYVSLRVSVIMILSYLFKRSTRFQVNHQGIVSGRQVGPYADTIWTEP